MVDPVDMQSNAAVPPDEISVLDDQGEELRELAFGLLKCPRSAIHG
ncbi:hypothetical protein [Micromonospora sediminimaris]|uniref:Uncharacterized protein n=1 Tax=Micromonospora sediminimaris TaxID=547162 RepID=A0A9W5UM39_9ACTN|nr:hypothetical protein [Micromonospora sediminimaris]GIJ30985.1 hypothetical protein Vse01_01330 [Micromonospora sediminimaris]SFC19119.1 hypothetical protein SAMN05216284_103136 [Micromonospora sediminimaris]